jgi:hypothetical protein
MAVLIAILFASPSQAQQPPAAPNTLWRFLGIPQTVHKSYDGLANRKGEHPGLERKPPLKALADPANLESDNPAIKAAAEIKQQEDLKPQKIKAIKYLAEIACGCYPGVKEALLAALDDCTEEVRYEAAVAFCKAAGNPCSLCNRATCCDQAVKDKLRDMALGTDANGCCKEPSARVRAAASMALNACNQIPTVAPAERKEGPTAVEGKETGEDALRGPLAPMPPGLPPTPTTETKAPSFVKPVSLSSDVFHRPESPEALAYDTETGELGHISVQHSGTRGIGCRCPRCLGRGVRPSYPSMPVESGGAAQQPAPAPGEEGVGELPGAAASPAPSALAGSFGAARAPASAAPSMIGDFFGGGYSYVTFGGDTSVVSTSAADRNFKIAENSSPIPADRVFFNYNHFANALETFDGPVLGLDRFNFGIEKTFWDENWSVELRIPFARGLDSTQVVGQEAGVEGTEFGNLAMAVKAVLLRGRCSTLSAGLGVVFPTGSDSELFFDDGAGSLLPLGSVQNEAVHMQPFLGHLWTPNDRLFVQSFAQLDFDLNGNQTQIRGVEGRLQDQSLLFLSTSIGYWAYRDPCARFVKGIAPVIELHYTTTLQSPDAAPAELNGETPEDYEIATITNPAWRQDIMNLTGGFHFQLFQSTRLTVAGAFPLRSNWDREFDAEFTMQLTHYY